MNSLFKLLLIVLMVFVQIQETSAQQRTYQAPEFSPNWHLPGKHPDHIILTFSGDPSESMSVTWRTDPSVSSGYAEIAPATAAPKFWRNAQTYEASTETMDATAITEAGLKSNYHSVTFTDLLPDTVYAYRVGDGKIWSEWFQFRTASKEEKPFSFLYVGDTQNYILELWSRLIREGYRMAPDASFIIHAGDLVNNAHHERQWHEWFTAAGFIHAMVPSVPVPGNHEYDPYNQEEDDKDIDHLSIQWKPQFTLPENGPKGLEETAYTIQYQDLKIVALNSSEDQETQAAWMQKELANDNSKWKIATFHHPIFSASERRDNADLRESWKPVFDQHGVDLVLQGHDHTYARGATRAAGVNVVEGVNTRDQATGTVYVVSVSGGKMYNLKENWDMYEASRERKAENTQLFQVINVNGDTLEYRAYTAIGELYDAFDLVKQSDGRNKIVEKKDLAIPERLHGNTIPYRD